MAVNFKIVNQRTKRGIHLNLTGDFDGTSACELLHAIRQLDRNKKPICINTDRLHNIYDFGCEVFRKNMVSVKNRSVKPVFQGRHRARLAS